MPIPSLPDWVVAWEQETRAKVGQQHPETRTPEATPCPQCLHAYHGMSAYNTKPDDGSFCPCPGCWIKV